jgi:hypothetical protein
MITGNYEDDFEDEDDDDDDDDDDDEDDDDRNMVYMFSYLVYLSTYP